MSYSIYRSQVYITLKNGLSENYGNGKSYKIVEDRDRQNSFLNFFFKKKLAFLIEITKTFAKCSMLL